jgi:GTP cyclohydrolase I
MAYKKIEQYDEKVTSGLIENYRKTLQLIGEDPTREGLEKTPERVAKAMQFLTQGYDCDANAILDSAKFKEEVSEMIIVKDIELYSMCEHHMLPFYGKAHVAYIPNGYITGLSKNSQGSGYLQPPPAGTGKINPPDIKFHKRNAEPPGCGRGY